jgi:MoxR-like ATPase
MLTASQVAIAAYAHAMMQAFAPASPPGRALAAWLHTNQCLIGLDFQAAMARAAPGGTPPADPDLEKPLPAALWTELREAVARCRERAPEPDVVTANIAAFAAALELDAMETAMLQFVFFVDYEDAFERLCDSIVETRALDSRGLMVLCLGLTPADIALRLSRGPLRALHLVEPRSNNRDYFGYHVPYRVVQALAQPGGSMADIERRLIGAPLATTLAAEDYGHVAWERDFVVRLLRGWTGGGGAGVNILIYGEPGTGKSEFCKMVAREAGCDLFGVGEADQDGDEPSRADRLESLRLADRLAARRGRALLLFDEMEDILDDGQPRTARRRRIRRAGSKVYFNRLLEQNQVPVLWTANALCEFDPAFLRRMTFAFEMKPLPTRLRARLWHGSAGRHGLALPPEQAEALARRHKVAPSLMTGAVAAVAMAGGAAEEIEPVVAALAKPFADAAPRRAAEAGRFESALANADLDLGRLQQALAAPGAPRDVSLCFYGPPGTGKSAFARQLADAMGLDPLLKRGSDLLSMWVGETERKLKRAFEEAREDSAFLIIDEAEGFLWSRAGADKSWEVTMVNELLVQMETHPLPFACTTNHLDRIDSAALRRFAFKVKFDFLSAAQSAEAYRRFFASEPPAALRQVANLTPGDFAVVAKKLRLLGELGDAAPDIVRLLAQEVEAKNLRATKIGF